MCVLRVCVCVYVYVCDAHHLERGREELISYVCGTCVRVCTCVCVFVCVCACILPRRHLLIPWHAQARQAEQQCNSSVTTE
jgi:hypothetical protein